MNCPGSVRLSAGMPNTASDAAIEGTRAHALAELALRKNVDTDTYVGLTLEDGEVTEDMAIDVDVYVKFARELIEGSTEHWIEHRFNLAALKPVLPLWGTADLVAYNQDMKTLDVADLKFGRGVVVEVNDNPQLKYYALGAALTLGEGRDIETVRLTIVQPRAGHPSGPIRSVEYTFYEIIEFASDLLAAAAATVAPDAPLVPGSQCRWCKASAVCPAQSMAVAEAAQMSFDKPYVEPRAVETLSQGELLKIMKIIPFAETYFKAVKDHIYRELAEGRPVPGYKLVAKRPSRKFKDAEAVVAWLKAQNISPDEYNVEPELRSVAQIEKLVGKKAFKTVESDFVNKVSSGVNMVPESHPSPAIESLAQEAFTALLPAPEADD